MYVIKDRFGNKFPWSKKGKNRECEVKDSKCIVRKCFKPEDCGTTDPKTQQKTIVGKCRTMHVDRCPDNWNKPENFVVYNERIERNERYDRSDRNGRRY